MKYAIQLGGESAGAALTGADAKELRVSFTKAIQQKHLNGRSAVRNKPAVRSRLHRVKTATIH